MDIPAPKMAKILAMLMRGGAGLREGSDVLGKWEELGYGL
jgi:hypothetical protein